MPTPRSVPMSPPSSVSMPPPSSVSMPPTNSVFILPSCSVPMSPSSSVSLPSPNTVSIPLPCSSSNIPVYSSIASRKFGVESTTTQLPTKLNNLANFNRNKTASKDLPCEFVKRKSGTMKGKRKQQNNFKHIKNVVSTIPEKEEKQNSPPRFESSLPSTVADIYNCQERTPTIHEALPVTSSSIMNEPIMSVPLTETVTASNKPSAEESKKVPFLITSGEQNDDLNGKYEELTDEKILQLMRSSIQTFEASELEQLDAEELEKRASVFSNLSRCSLSLDSRGSLLEEMSEEDLKGIRSDFFSLISRNSMDYDQETIVTPEQRQSFDLSTMQDSDNIIAPDSILADLGLHNSSVSLLSSFSGMSVNSRRFSSFLSTSMMSRRNSEIISRRVSEMSFQFCDELDEDNSDDRLI